jgi:hypothetical protein
MAAVAIIQALQGQRGKGYDPATNHISGSYEVVAGEQEVYKVVLRGSWAFRPAATHSWGPSGEVT